MSTIIPLIVAGLALFLLGINRLSHTLREAFSDQVKEFIARYTGNLFLSILVGILTTIILNSSSAVTILSIVLINAGSLSFRQAIGIILGANIGTTFSSQIISFDVSQYSFIPLVIGVVLLIINHNKRFELPSRIFLFFGMIFFGLFVIKEAVYPLRNSEVFYEWITGIGNNPWKGALVGGFVTTVIGSSSAAVGMAIAFGQQNMITIAGGIAIMLGAELGTCADTLVALINGKRQAVKSGLFQFGFNLMTLILGLAFFEPLIKLINWISGDTDIARHIANGHMVFNILGVVLIIPFVPLLEKWLNRLIPDKN